jgi:hypothetical protein
MNRSITGVFLTPALGGGEWSASHPGRFTLGERAPDTHFIGGWVSPRTCLDAVQKKKRSLIRAGNRTPAVEPVTAPTETSRSITLIYLSSIKYIIIYLLDAQTLINFCEFINSRTLTRRGDGKSETFGHRNRLAHAQFSWRC